MWSVDIRIVLIAVVFLLSYVWYTRSSPDIIMDDTSSTSDESISSLQEAVDSLLEYQYDLFAA
jgi:hypothetical protein